MIPFIIFHEQFFHLSLSFSLTQRKKEKERDSNCSYFAASRFLYFRIILLKTNNIYCSIFYPTVHTGGNIMKKIQFHSLAFVKNFSSIIIPRQKKNTHTHTKKKAQTNPIVINTQRVVSWESETINRATLLASLSFRLETVEITERSSTSCIFTPSRFTVGLSLRFVYYNRILFRESSVPGSGSLISRVCVVSCGGRVNLTEPWATGKGRLKCYTGPEPT